MEAPKEQGRGFGRREGASNGALDGNAPRPGQYRGFGHNLCSRAWFGSLFSAPWTGVILRAAGWACEANRQSTVWDEAKGQFVPVWEVFFTLSFDHRVLDGGAAGRLLARIAQLLAEPDKL